MTVEQSFRQKLYSLIYPKGTPKLSEENSTYLGTTAPWLLPNRVDDFYRIWFKDFDNWVSWFGPFRGFMEGWFKDDRFVSFAEYQDGFKDRVTTPELQSRYPIYRLMNIVSERKKQKFLIENTNDEEGYFRLMKKKNPKLWALFKNEYKAKYPDRLRNTHGYGTGKSGSGKTEAMNFDIVQNIKKADSCIIVIEPNGDFAQQVAMQIDLPPERLVYVTFDVDGRTTRINPLELIKGKSEDDIQNQTQIVRNALNTVLITEKGEFSSSQHILVEACLDVIVRQKGTLSDLLRFMIDGENDDLVAAGKQIPNHREFFERVFFDTSLKRSKLSIYKKLSTLLKLNSVREFLCGKTTINIQKAIKDKKVIVFNLNKGKLGEYASAFIGKMLLAMLESVIYQRANMTDSEREDQKLLIYIDEAQEFITPSLDNMFAQFRKYNAGVFMATQIVGQSMSAELTKVILSCTSVKLAGINGYATLSVMSKENYASIDDLRTLSVGQFFCRIGEGQGFILNVPDTHLKQKTCKSAEEWKIVLAGQTSRYYQPIEGIKTENKRSKPPNKLPPDQLDGENFTPKF